MFSEYTKNFLIYCQNLSIYYVLCVLISVAAIILTWIIGIKTRNIEQVNQTKFRDSVDEANMELENILLTYKKSRQRRIQDITSNLTEDQLIDEKRAEQEQLSAILQLLKKQEDKFQVGSMEELEGQLKLYR